MLLGALVALDGPPPALPSAPRPAGQLAPLASPSMGLSVTGSSPGAVSLAWTESTDVLFTSYQVDESSTGANGPWTIVSTISNVAATTFYWSGLAPDQTYWWQVTVYDTVVVSAMSPAVAEQQPAVAAISATLSGPSTAQLQWTNGASYTGSVALVAYTIEVSAANGSPSSLPPIHDAATLSLTVGNLSNGTQYRFQLRTTDGCSSAANCGSGPGPSTTVSNAATLVTPRPLGAAVSPYRTTVSVNASVAFACTSSGGAAPYHYAWTFGDGSTSSGSAAVHQYPQAGTFQVTCTVTDAFRSTSTGRSTVTVAAPTSGGGGSNGSGGGTGGGTGSGNGSGSSGGGSGGGSGTSSPGGSGGSGAPASTSSPLGKIAAIGLALVVVGAVAWLALLARHRRRAAPSPAPLPGGAESGEATSTVAPPPVDPSSVEVEPTPEAASSADIDRMMDELESVSEPE
jgi:hypothetical protein